MDGEDLMGRQTPLLLAVKGGHTGTARSVVHLFAHSNKETINTSLIIYRLLLEYGASVLRVVDGRTIQGDKIPLS